MEKKKNIWTWIDSVKADKVILVVLILLSAFSLITVFSSTSLSTDVMNGTASRADKLWEQVGVIALGLVIVFFTYKLKWVGLIRFISQGLFIFSLIIVFPLMIHMNAGQDGAFIKAVCINDAWRCLSIKGLQLHVFEFMKVFMMMYLAWAVDALKEKRFGFTNRLYEKHPDWRWLRPDGWFVPFFYIGLPVIIATVCFATGSASSAIFMCLMMFLTLFVGGVGFKKLLSYVCILFVLMIAGYGLYKAGVDSLKGPYQRVDTAVGRLTRFADKGDDGKSWRELIEEAPTPATRKARREAIDLHTQPESAKIAIHEGGLIGKGPGRSTQKYRTSEMFSDYVYSFIIEEYGMFGGIIVLILYVSLLARGSVIARNCKKTFAKTVVAGLTLLISCQAMMHMMINVGLGPITGQTLPMLSDGKSAMIAFYIAFAILLNISKTVKKQVEAEAEKAGALIPETSTGTATEAPSWTSSVSHENEGNTEEEEE